MTVVNKVSSFHCMLNIYPSHPFSISVCRLWLGIQYELPTSLHTIHSLRGMRCTCQTPWSHLLPRLRLQGCKNVVPHQRHARWGHIYRVQEPRKFPHKNALFSLSMQPNNGANCKEMIAILEYPRVHYLQEFDDHSHCKPKSFRVEYIFATA